MRRALLVVDVQQGFADVGYWGRRSNPRCEANIVALMAAWRAAGQPIVRITLAKPDLIGQEFFRWEIATAVAGAIIGIDPFDHVLRPAHGLGSRDVDADLLHRLDGDGVHDVSGRGSSGVDRDCVAAQFTRPPRRHLGSPGVVGAEKENGDRLPNCHGQRAYEQQMRVHG